MEIKACFININKDSKQHILFRDNYFFLGSNVHGWTENMGSVFCIAEIMFSVLSQTSF